MTREEILGEIDHAGLVLGSLRSRAPSDELLEVADRLLAALRDAVISRWPLDESLELGIGRFAVRAFDDESYPELVTLLIRVDALARGRRPKAVQDGDGSDQPSD